MFFSLVSLSLWLMILGNVGFVCSKSTIEPSTSNDSCPALVGYTLYTDLKVAEVASLFQIDPIDLLAANSIDLYASDDVVHQIFPKGVFLKVPVSCRSWNGIRKALVTYGTGSSSADLADIAGNVYGGLVTADQIKAASSLSGDGTGVPGGANLSIPLPCACFNLMDNSLPTIYLSYLVVGNERLGEIARKYSITLTDIMNVNGLSGDTILPGDILAVPLPACASNLNKYASDNGLIVANGSYFITAGHCVQCSCGPGNLNLYCTPSSLTASCSSMQCRNSKLTLGNVTTQPSSGGCKVTSCSYNGFVNGVIWMTLSTSLQPRCPAAQQFPPVIEHPAASALPPSPSPEAHSGGVAPATAHRSSALSPSQSIPGITTAGPSGSTSHANSLMISFSSFPVIVLCLFSNFMMSRL